jgi:hypothetical protein
LKLFLDVEGTLIVNQQGDRRIGHDAADHLDEFLGWALGVANCHWLTGVDCSGSSDRILQAFRTILGRHRYLQLQPLLLSIKPTRWGRSKLHAIDLAEPGSWFWVDDNHGKAELAILQSLGLEERAINCPYNGLRQVRAQIEALIASAEEVKGTAE